MSYLAANVPRMENNLEDLTAAVNTFAADHGMTIVPAIPSDAPGQRVSFHSWGLLDLSGFLELAGKLGDGAIYLQAETFGLDPETGEPDNIPPEMEDYKGQICQLDVAFASAGHGLLHFWDQTEVWYQEWLNTLDEDEDSPGNANAYDDRIRQDEEKRDQQAEEIAEAILADPVYRSSSPQDRRRRGQLLFPGLLPEGTDRWVGWTAAQRALERAKDLTEQAYAPVRARIGDLAAEFLASPGWQEAASASLRKKAAEEFLIPLGDGFFPPTVVRDELYAQAQKIAKTGAKSGLF